ncbi:hypothetical protein pb186bvf_008161 [Paramecium bursaria]
MNKLLQIQYPLIQAPMLGVSTPEMAAIVSEAGGLGSLPLGGLSPEICQNLIRRTKKLTNKPFAVNLFTYEFPERNELHIQNMKSLLQKQFGLQKIQECRQYSYHEQLDVLLQEDMKIISFTFGIPQQYFFDKFKDCVLMGTATCLEEAQQLEPYVEYIVAQGIEAGGHRGSFQTNNIPQIGLFPLVRTLVKEIKKPIIAAGAIHDNQSYRAAFELGASMAQVGSAFISSHESLAIQEYKVALKKSKDQDIVLTKCWSGRYGRGIKNDFVIEIEGQTENIPEYPYQNSLTQEIRKKAIQERDIQNFNMWTGQCGMYAQQLSTKEIFQMIIK